MTSSIKIALGTRLVYNTKQNVTRGAVFLYIETIAAMIAGYAFWLVISKLTTPDVIGTSGALYSFSAIVSTIINLGIPISMQRFLGKSFLNKKYAESRLYILSSLILLLVAVVVGSTAFILCIPLISQLTEIHFNPVFVLLVLGLSISSAIGRLLRGVIIASLKTGILVTANAISTAAKFGISIVLISAGTGVVGLTIGILAYTVAEAAIMSMTVFNIFKLRSDEKPQMTLRSTFKPILIGGTPNWIPTLITSFGIQLGTILVFGLHGSSEAGYYFIAYSVYSALAAVIGVIFSITFPVLSSMEKGHGYFVWRTIKFSLMIALPFSFSFLFYPADVLSLFGEKYASGAAALDVLLLSLVPVTITGGITNLQYAKGDYRKAMLVGIATSLPRTIVYFILVPIWGGNGAAITFTAGALIGLIISVILSRGMEMRIIWKDILLLSVIPIIVAYVVNISSIQYMIGIFLSIAITYVAYFKLCLADAADIKDALSVLPARISRPAFKILGSIKREKSNV
jgi:O-antigen/teichoic acid export membrane protein